MYGYTQKDKLRRFKPRRLVFVYEKKDGYVYFKVYWKRT